MDEASVLAVIELTLFMTVQFVIMFALKLAGFQNTFCWVFLSFLVMTHVIGSSIQLLEDNVQEIVQINEIMDLAAMTPLTLCLVSVLQYL
jgi:hypothetical protein